MPPDAARSDEDTPAPRPPRPPLPTRVSAALRAEPLLWLLCAAGCVCVLLPVWIARYVPLLDYPNHLSMVFVWFHIDDPSWNFAPYYTINLPPLPYWAHYGLVYALSFVAGPEVAQKLFLSAALLGFPLALAVYARRVGRDPRLALLAFPLAWSYSTANGFLSYVAGIPVMFLSLAVLDRWAERPSLRWVDLRFGLLAALLGATLYFFHVLPWVLFLLVGGLCALIGPRPWSPVAALAGALPTLPAALLGAVAYRASQHVKTPFNPWNSRGLAGFEGAHNDLFTNLSSIPGWLINFHPGDSDEQALLAIAACWLGLLALRGGPPDATDGARVREDEGRPRGFRLEVAFAVFATALLKLPRSLMRPFYWYGVNGRLAVIVALAGALLPRGPIVGLRRALLYLGCAAGLVYCVDLAAHFRRFNERAAGFDEVLAAAPPGKQVLPIMLQLSDPDISVNAYNQWGSYVQLRQGGYMQFNFVSEFPVRYKKRLPAPQWDHPETFNFGLHESGWDYFLVRGPSKVEPFAGHERRVRLVKRAGDWALWEKLPPPPTPPPAGP